MANAIKYYEDFLSNNPSNKDVITNLGIAYRATGNLEKAQEFDLKLVQLKAQ